MGLGSRPLTNCKRSKMASLAKLCLRGASLAQASRTLPAIATRSFGSGSVCCKVFGKDTNTMDPYEHATGQEKQELTAKRAGNDDPYFIKSREKGVGTKENPNIVDALDTYRMIGCVCNEDDTSIKWMWIYEGHPKRCICGTWYKLVRHDAQDRFELPV